MAYLHVSMSPKAHYVVTNWDKFLIGKVPRCPRGRQQERQRPRTARLTTKLNELLARYDI